MSFGGESVASCLLACEVDPEELAAAGTLDEQWKVVKKFYFRKILQVHPDKGGDKVAFRNVQVCFEVLRALYEAKAMPTFTGPSMNHSTAEAFTASMRGFDNGSVPSWEFYQEAAEAEVPTYRVEVAKSARSACRSTKYRDRPAVRCKAKKGQAPPLLLGDDAEAPGLPPPEGQVGTVRFDKEGRALINQGDVRIGWFNLESGTYWMWNSVQCWRVPSKVWLGLPKGGTERMFEEALGGMNEVQLSGFNELPPREKRIFVEHVMDESNWAKLIKRAVPKDTAHVAPSSEDLAGFSSGYTKGFESKGRPKPPPSAARDVVPLGEGAKKAFVTPVPGRDGPANCLAGKRCVCTGTFPEIGGGRGLELGKARVRALIESFGGIVGSSISGATDVLIVGKSPGISKVSKARAQPRCVLMDLVRVVEGIARGELDGPEDAAPFEIQGGFSSGYGKLKGGPNGLALTASPEALALARGTAPALLAAPQSSLPAPTAPPRKRPAGGAPVGAPEHAAAPLPGVPKPHAKRSKKAHVSAAHNAPPRPHTHVVDGVPPVVPSTAIDCDVPDGKKAHAAAGERVACPECSLLLKPCVSDRIRRHKCVRFRRFDN